jgi:hypothetical protein
MKRLAFVATPALASLISFAGAAQPKSRTLFGDRRRSDA